MSARRGAGARAPPAAARPGTLCGPAITLATSGRYGHAAMQTESKLPLPRFGTIVKVDNGNYAVQCDRHSKLWWYPKARVLGAKLYVKGSDSVVIPVTHWYDSASEYEVGTKVQFVPYERSELKFVEHYVVFVEYGVEEDIQWRAPPHNCAGVATQVRRLG